MTDTTDQALITDEPAIAEAPPARTRQPEAVRRRIIDASRVAFAARGFDGATLPGIGKAAGISVALIVYHFKSKHALWVEVMKDTVEREGRHFSGIASDPDLPASTRLRRMIEHQVRLFAGLPELHQLMSRETGQMSDRLKWLCDTYTKQTFGLMVSMIEAAQHEGKVRMIAPERLRYAIIGIASVPAVNAEFEYLTGRDVRSPDEVRQTIDIINRLVFIDS